MPADGSENDGPAPPALRPTSPRPAAGVERFAPRLSASSQRRRRRRRRRRLGLAAAAAGAQVTALDITPKLVDEGRARTVGQAVEWIVGDAQDLPFDDDSFDLRCRTSR